LLVSAANGVSRCDARFARWLAERSDRSCSQDRRSLKRAERIEPVRPPRLCRCLAHERIPRPIRARQLLLDM